MECRSMCGNIWKSSTGNDGLHRFLQMESIGFLLSCTGSSGLQNHRQDLKDNLYTENDAVLHGDLIKMSEIGFLQGKITYDL